MAPKASSFLIQVWNNYKQNNKTSGSKLKIFVTIRDYKNKRKSVSMSLTECLWHYLHISRIKVKIVEKLKRMCNCSRIKIEVCRLQSVVKRIIMVKLVSLYVISVKTIVILDWGANGSRAYCSFGHVSQDSVFFLKYFLKKTKTKTKTGKTSQPQNAVGIYTKLF